VDFHKAKPVSLRGNPLFSEKWLQGLIAEDPSLLGLGDLVLVQAERRQPRAGRLDLLLVDPDEPTRYEVEIQLGPTDEAHIIRAIEYWDIERSRYPQYEHVAVLVAEDITSRFLNVISLFNRAIPLVAIQMRALDVGGMLTLSATTVLNVTRLGTDEEDEPGQATDRSYWIQRSSSASVSIADEVLALVNAITPGMQLKYNKHYIGLARDGIADNFVQVRPRRSHAVLEIRLPRSDETSALLDGSSLDVLSYAARWGRYRMSVSSADIAAHQDLLLDLIRQATGTPAPNNG